MAQTLSVVIAILLGVGGGLQVGLLGAMSRSRGSIEATLISILGTITVISAVLAVQSVRGAHLALPPPFTSWLLFLGITVAAGMLLALGLTGLPAYFALTGAFAAPYLIGASFLVPRLGVGLFLGSVITGQLLGGLLLDHLGALGTEARPIDAPRLLGALALIAGVILIRGFR